MSNWAKAWIGLTAATSIYVAIGLTTGSASAFAAFFFHADEYKWFAIGMTIPIGPLYLFYSSGFMMRRLLLELRNWHKEGIINEEDYNKVRRDALQWFSDRRFGRGREGPDTGHTSVIADT